MEFNDDPSADIAAALEQIEKGETGSTAPDKPADAQPSEVSPQAHSQKGEASDGDRARDEAGRFAAKAAEPAAKAEGADADVTAVTAAVPPPAHWKGNGKIAWDKLPPEVRQHISEDYAQVTNTQTELGRIKAAIGPDRAQVLAANYGSVEQGLQSILAGSDFANKNPQGFILWLAQRAGIDLTTLAGQGAGDGQQPAQQQPHPLVNEINSLRNELQQLKQQSTQAPIQSQIDAMASDAAKYPYFNDLRPNMAALIQSGAAKTLTEAYEQAAWSRPDIRTSLLEAERKKSADAEAAKAATAKAAAISVTGSPRGAKAPEGDLNEPIEETIRKAYERLHAA